MINKGVLVETWMVGDFWNTLYIRLAKLKDRLMFNSKENLNIKLFFDMLEVLSCVVWEA